jgi:hypothetical protein
MLLIHGARAVLSPARTVSDPDRLRTWALTLEKRAHHNKATVALANKLARIAWAVSVKTPTIAPCRPPSRSREPNVPLKGKETNDGLTTADAGIELDG